MSSTVPLLELSGISFTVRDRNLLSDISLRIDDGSSLCILGPNGSGKSLLVRILSGSLEPTSGARVVRDGVSRIGCVSFELQKAVMAEERRNDDSPFLHGMLDPGRTVSRFLREAAPPDGGDLLPGLLSRFGLERAASRGLRFLSSGEFRKTLIVRALISRPVLLVLDDPYDGLDAESRDGLKAALEIIRGTLPIVLATGRLEDVPGWIDDAVVLRSGRIAWAGPVPGARAVYGNLREAEKASAAGMVSGETENLREEPGRRGPTFPASLSLTGCRKEGKPESLVRMHDVSVNYRGIPVLTGIDWEVVQGRHWRVSGPNGSGKSTLLDLVYGDNPKAYGQNIELFGRRKGSGESVWDIRKRIGFVSGGFHMNYPESQRVLGVILSGFYDSAGLYRDPGPAELETAERWCSTFGLSGYLKTPFGELSFGLQRIALMARALVKNPEVLILDEPCQGVDDANTDLILSAAELIVRGGRTTLIYVTHDSSHLIRGVDNDLRLVPHPSGGFTARI